MTTQESYEIIDELHKKLNAYQAVSAYTAKAVLKAIEEIKESIKVESREVIKKAYVERLAVLEASLKVIEQDM